MITETSSPQTPPTAIWSRDAETLRIHPGFDRENSAIPRGFGIVKFLKRTGDGRFGVLCEKSAEQEPSRFQGLAACRDHRFCPISAIHLV